MKAQEKTEKDYIKFRFATALDKLLSRTEWRSLKEFATHTGMEPAHIAKISRGELDVSLTTCIAISNGIGIPYAQLAREYDSVTEGDIKTYMDKLDARKRLRGKEKIPLKKKVSKRSTKK